MKRLLFLFTAFFITLGATAQVITDNPRVDYNYNSSSGWNCNILRVALTEEYTYIFFDCIVPRNCRDCWVSLSSNTVLSDANGNSFTPLRIDSWGVFDDGEASSLDFNENYSVNNDRRYIFYMAFPLLHTGVTKISITERTSQGTGWSWRGIHIDNPSSSYARRSSSQGSSSSSSSGSRYSGADNGARSGSYGGDTGYGSGSYGGSGSGSSSSRSDQFELAGTGTCFALTSSGYLATCYHVVEDATQIRIRGVGGNFDRTYRARIVITDKSNDLAIVKIDDPSFSSLGTIPYTVANSMVDVGEDVFALGYPLKAYMGDEIKLTNGIVSSRTGFQGDATSYQLSVAVYPGNSGGPLFDNRGNVVGVVNARLLESATYAVKTPYLHTLAQSADGVYMSESNTLAALSLSEKVKRLRNFVYVIEIAQ